MSEKEDIQRCFENKVKCIASNMATRFIECDELHWDWDERLREAARERDKALMGLSVKIERRHLQTLTDWFIKALGAIGPLGCDRKLGRSPSCFGTSSGKCYPVSIGSSLADSPLCQACIAISALLRED